LINFRINFILKAHRDVSIVVFQREIYCIGFEMKNTLNNPNKAALRNNTNVIQLLNKSI